MARRLMLHMRSRIAEIRAMKALRRAADALNEHTFFRLQLDGYVRTLKAK